MKDGRYSNYKIAWDKEKLSDLENGRITFPRYVRIKPTNKCCHNCWFCVYDKNNSGMHETFNREDEMSRNQLLSILLNLHYCSVGAITFSGGGEPLLHPDICDALYFVKKFGIKYSVLTNGQYLSGTRADILRDASWVRISADYYSKRSYKLSGRGDMFEQTMDNIYLFSLNKSETCELSMNFIVTHQNCNKLYQAAEFWKDKGIETIRFSPVWIKRFSMYHAGVRPIAESQINIAKAMLEDDKFTIQSGYSTQSVEAVRCYSRCYYQEVVPAIGADCNVYRCHNTAYSEHGLIGSLKDRSFMDMWNSEETANKIKGYDASVCAHQCANDRKNEFINELLSCKGDLFY